MVFSYRQQLKQIYGSRLKILFVFLIYTQMFLQILTFLWPLELKFIVKIQFVRQKILIDFEGYTCSLNKIQPPLNQCYWKVVIFLKFYGGDSSNCNFPDFENFLNVFFLIFNVLTWKESKNAKTFFNLFGKQNIVA